MDRLGLLILCFLVRIIAAEFSESEWMNVAQCQASCLEKFTTAPPSDGKCDEDALCTKCFELCAKFVREENSQEYMCNSLNDQVCDHGCQIACNAITTIRQTRLSSRSTPWIFTSDPSFYELQDLTLELEWTPPVPYSIFNLVARDTYVIYQLLLRDSPIGDWTHVLMTADTYCLLPQYLMKRIDVLQFMIRAISKEGEVAATTPIFPPSHPRSGDAPSVFDVLRFLMTSKNHTNPPVTTTTSTPTENDPYQVEHTEGHSHTTLSASDYDLGLNVEAFVKHRAIVAQAQWMFPASCTLWWSRETCSADSGFPACHEKKYKYHYAVDVEPGPESQCEYALPSLTFNSKYWLSLECPNVRSHSIFFVTPGCSAPSQDFTQCQDENMAPTIDEAIADFDIGKYTTLFISLLTGVLFLVIGCVFCKCRKQAKKKKQMKQRMDFSPINADTSILSSRFPSMHSIAHSSSRLQEVMKSPHLRHNETLEASTLNFYCPDATYTLNNNSPQKIENRDYVLYYDDVSDRGDIYSEQEGSPERTPVPHIVVSRCESNPHGDISKLDDLDLSCQSDTSLDSRDGKGCGKYGRLAIKDGLFQPESRL